jgi:hypothetical protein
VRDITSGGHDQSVVTVIAPIWQTEAGHSLVPALDLDAQGGFQPLAGEQGGVAVEGLELKGLHDQPAGSYGVSRVTGEVRVDGQGARRIVEAQGKVVAPIALGLRELLVNSEVYEGQVIAVEASLLLNSSSALLVDGVGPGGVPTADSRQLKLAEPAPDVPVLRRLEGAAGQTVVRSQVSVVGLWRDGRLVVFWVDER